MSILGSQWLRLRVGLPSLGLVLMAGGAVRAQETRSTLLGTVKDATGALVPGATVEITNSETNVTSTAITNNSGYYEVPYLLPGGYTLSASLAGFKKYVRQGIALTVNSRINIDVTLEVGAASESVTVTASAPLLETTTGNGSASLEQRQISDLPVFSNSALLLARSTPGVQWTAAPNYLGLHSNVGASSISAAGGVGGNEFSLDGVPNLAGGRRTGYLPYTDTIADFKVETAPFDASKGHTTSATITMMTKSGTNDYHGALTWQHWQQRLNATQATTNAAYWGPIKAAEGRGDTAAVQRLLATERQPSGHSNNYSGSIGGPVRLPWLFNGRDKLFFFFNYSGFKDAKSEEATAVNRTVPSDAARKGDFSDLLKLDPVRYQIYDPRTAHLVNGRVVRDPFPNNQVPVLNPLYGFYEKLYPHANNVPGVVSAEGANNYLASATPYNWDYKANTGRVDFQLSPKQHLFGKYSYSNFLEDRGDWVYETARGLLVGGLVRKNIGITFDHVYALNSTTIFNGSIAWNRFIEGNVSNAVQTSFPPSKAGLPGYLDQKAGDFIHLPSINFNAYSSLNRGYPGFTRYSIGTVRGEATKFIRTHSLRVGIDLRENWRAAFGPGQSAGSFSFNNSFVRQADNTTNAAAIGLEWAAFMLGVPSGVSVSTNDSYYLTNWFYSGYVQDDWKLSRRLTLNLGLRYELEDGFRERYNRGLAGFDPNGALPIADAAQAAYAKNPLPERPASDFLVRGGTLYLANGASPDTMNNAKAAWMPRVGFAYQINDKTVLRGGWGMFYDTNNVLNDGINQTGYSRGTGTTITNDNGLTFNFANLTSPECRADITRCKTIFADPFPLRADGTRFDVPLGNALGLMTLAGRSYTYVPRDWERARQHRWRAGLQRELRGNMVAEVAYLGSYTDNITVFNNNGTLTNISSRIDFLPEKYWASGLVRNNALADDLNSTVANPFNIANFASIQASNPTLYNDMRTNGFFTATTIRKAQLLRAFPQMNGLFNGRTPSGEVKYNDLEASVTKRMAGGYSYMVAYTWASNLQRTTYENEFDALPVWTPSNNSAPHHLTANLICEFPFGKGRRFLPDKKRLSAIIGGWQISGLYHLQTGRVYGLGNWFYFGNDLRDIGLDGDARGTDAWFNWKLFPGASRDFSASDRSVWEARIRQLVPENMLPPGKTYATVTPTDFQPNSFHRRVFPTALNWLRGPRLAQLDANIARRFRTAEKTNLEFRLDLINALNTVQWDLPSTDINSSNFGKLTEQRNTPRWVQFQLRYTF